MTVDVFGMEKSDEDIACGRKTGLNDSQIVVKISFFGIGSRIEG